MATGMNPQTITIPEYAERVQTEREEALATGVKFRSRPIYDPKDDCLIYFMRDVLSYRKRVNSLLTVHLSVEDKTLVGCEVKSVTRMVRLRGSFGVVVADRKLNLGAFLAFALAPKLAEPDADNELEQYEQDLEQFKDVEIEEELLTGAAP